MPGRAGLVGDHRRGGCARAGVSRGAVQYHFPTREDLVLAAVEQMADQRAAEARARLVAHGDTGLSAEQVVRDVVDIYSGELFRAALALWLAAVSEPALRERVRRLEARISRDAHRMVVEALGADESVPGVREAIQVTLDWARGLGLAGLLTDDRAPQGAVGRILGAVPATRGGRRQRVSGSARFGSGIAAFGSVELPAGLLRDRVASPARTAWTARVALSGGRARSRRGGR
ncbi:MAG: TetR/AcrR family transcriptional regulator [Microthrixaceae bacterium]|nr:TetR/AcrR family transcriptional regulator [Microthrixaceae bacterium]